LNKENTSKLWKIIQEAGDYLHGQLPQHPNHPKGRNPYAHVALCIKEKFKTSYKNIDNYIEIYIKTDKKNIIKKKYKKLYFNTKNLVGLKIKPEFPKNPEITIKNDLNKSIKKLSQDLIKKIKQKIG